MSHPCSTCPRLATDPFIVTCFIPWLSKHVQSTTDQGTATWFCIPSPSTRPTSPRGSPPWPWRGSCGSMPSSISVNAWSWCLEMGGVDWVDLPESYGWKWLKMGNIPRMTSFFRENEVIIKFSGHPIFRQTHKEGVAIGGYWWMLWQIIMMWVMHDNTRDGEVIWLLRMVVIGDHSVGDIKDGVLIHSEKIMFSWITRWY